ncbi:MAG: hypothetical protein RLZZ476_400, partial [Verrucomicrobiota bacterium]
MEPLPASYRLPMVKKALFALLPALSASLALAADPVEADYYKITTFQTPKETALEVGSIDLMPDGRLALGTRRGEVWLVSGASSSDPSSVSYQLFASGLHEVLGMAFNPKDGCLYATTRYEITRLKDTDGDGRADVFDNVNDDWGVSGDYHEYAIGSRFDRKGDLWVTLCLTGSFSSQVPFRGWALRITP